MSLQPSHPSQHHLIEEDQDSNFRLGGSQTVSNRASQPQHIRMINDDASMETLPAVSNRMQRKRSNSSASLGAPEIAPKPDGRHCRLCHEQDLATDPVDGGFRAWYYPRQDGKTQGHFCFYCGRTWHARFRHKYSSLGDFAKACGEQNELLQAFMGLQGELVQKCQVAKTREIRLATNDLQTKVVGKERLKTALVDEDEFVELSYYMSSYRGGLGHPSTNGLGHQLRTIDGCTGVIVPGAPIKKIKREKAQIVEKQHTYDDGSLTLSQDQHDSVMQDVFAQFQLPPALGRSVAEMDAAATAAATSSSQPSSAPQAGQAKAASSASSDAGLPLDSGFGGFFKVSAKAEKQVEVVSPPVPTSKKRKTAGIAVPAAKALLRSELAHEILSTKQT